MNFHQFFSGNTWWGKILGGIFGYLAGGPAGALFGILVGNLFDKALAEHFSQPFWQYRLAQHPSVQQLFFEATFTTMGFIAKADGRVSEEEIQMACLIMDDMRLGKEQKRKARLCYNLGKSTAFNPEDVLTRLANTCHNNRELLRFFIDIQYKAAQAGGLSTAKLQALNQIFKQLGFAPLQEQYRFYEDFSFKSSQSNNQYRRYKSSPQATQNTLTRAYALLEISADADQEEVKRAYRRLISRNHPDKLIAQGLPEEMIKLANDKTQAITKAYKQICEVKGW